MTQPKILQPVAAEAPFSDEAMAVRARLEAAYDLSSASAAELLSAGLKAYDTARSAEAILARDGLVVLDRYGTPKAHPACDIARQARAQWFTCLRLLALTGLCDE